MDEYYKRNQNEKFGKSLNQFSGDKDYEELYSQLTMLRNRLNSCPEQWNSLCLKKAKEVNSVLEEWKFEYLEEKSKEYCKSYLTVKTIAEYNNCVSRFKRRGMLTIHDQINKHTTFLNRI